MPALTTKKLEIYVAKNGDMPFVTWLESLDPTIRARIKEKLDRVALGNFGDHKFITKGIYELRLTFGAGYRIYYGLKNRNFIILLCGGNKSSQKNDIKKAVSYWIDYLG